MNPARGPFVNAGPLQPAKLQVMQRFYCAEVSCHAERRCRVFGGGRARCPVAAGRPFAQV
eukprot:9389586-Pyramimonas_sp.AAC.1